MMSNDQQPNPSDPYVAGLPNPGLYQPDPVDRYIAVEDGDGGYIVVDQRDSIMALEKHKIRVTLYGSLTEVERLEEVIEAIQAQKRTGPRS